MIASAEVVCLAILPVFVQPIIAHTNLHLSLHPFATEYFDLVVVRRTQGDSLVCTSPNYCQPPGPPCESRTNRMSRGGLYTDKFQYQQSVLTALPKRQSFGSDMSSPLQKRIAKDQYDYSRNTRRDRKRTPDGFSRPHNFPIPSRLFRR